MRRLPLKLLVLIQRERCRSEICGSASFYVCTETHKDSKETICINNILQNVSIFKRWSGRLLRAVMRALWAKWTNIPEIIIPKLDSAWGAAPCVCCWTNSTAEMFIQLKDIQPWILLNVVESASCAFVQSNVGYTCVLERNRASKWKVQPPQSFLFFYFLILRSHEREIGNMLAALTGPDRILSAAIVNVHPFKVSSGWVGLKDLALSKFFMFVWGGSRELRLLNKKKHVWKLYLVLTKISSSTKGF